MSKIYSKWYNQCLYWRRFVDRDARKAMFTNVTCLWRHGDSTIARGKPHHHNRVHGTTGTLWIDGGALTNHQCSLATGRGNKFYTNIYDDPAVEFFWVSFPFLEHRNTYIFIKSAHWILSMHIRLYWNGLFWYVQSGYMWIIYIYMYIYTVLVTITSQIKVPRRRTGNDPLCFHAERCITTCHNIYPGLLSIMGETQCKHHAVVQPPI